MVLGFLSVWRGLVFVAHSWPGLASFWLRKKNMHEVEECWDVAILSDWNWYQSRPHNFMYWEQERNILQLRGAEALGTFSVCGITGCVKPNLALCLQRSQALVELCVFLLSVCCSLLPTDEKCYCSSCSWVQCWVICLKCITCVTRILLDDLIVPFTLKLCEIRQYISLNVAAVWQTELKRF